VASPFESPQITVFGEYFPQDQLTVASFMWPRKNSAETYTIAANETLSLELDKKYPVRLTRIALYDAGVERSEELIRQLTSAELSQKMVEAPRIGQFVLGLDLSTRSRLLLARFQAADPSTPPHIRRACSSLLSAHQPLPRHV